MEIRNILQAFVASCFWLTLGLSACQTSTTATETTEPVSTEEEATETKRLSPARVDVRGSIIRHRYTQGQVILEVEGPPNPDARFNRAIILVLPTTQIFSPDGKNLTYSDLQQGQNISALLQAGGRGTLQGTGTARRVWVEKF